MGLLLFFLIDLFLFFLINLLLFFLVNPLFFLMYLLFFLLDLLFYRRLFVRLCSFYRLGKFMIMCIRAVS